jgi:hypothetical protein
MRLTSAFIDELSKLAMVSATGASSAPQSAGNTIGMSVGAQPHGMAQGQTVKLPNMTSTAASGMKLPTLQNQMGPGAGYAGAPAQSMIQSPVTAAAQR